MRPDEVGKTASGDELPVADIDRQRFGPPIVRPGLLLCIGLSYRPRAIETGTALLDEPVVLMKPPHCIASPADQLAISRGSMATDWEVGLAVVIGRCAHCFDTTEHALDCVAKYALSHDVSEGAIQLERGGQWAKGQSCATFNLLGTLLVSSRDVDPDDLLLDLWVSDELRQSASTADVIFGVNQLLPCLSQFTVLEPGDVINTGTPHGVGLARKGPSLQPGDRVRLKNEFLGNQQQDVIAA